MDGSPASSDTKAMSPAAARAESPRRIEPWIPRGSTIGRYIVLHRLAAGGMGVVHAAYDPELDRRVAVKLLKSYVDTDDEEAEREAARLLRESRAMARLSHPNVVAVYDVGTHDGSVFMAMELVEGQTLRAWLAKTKASWREIVRVMLQAGKSLAAAHAAGLVHLDVKPSNVLVADNGRVYVTDFGIARTPDGPLQPAPPNEIAADLEASGRLPTIEDVDDAGRVVGTPSFMAPEQAAAEATDARTDQFSFCVTLYFALYRELPFAQHENSKLADFTRLREAPATTVVPPWVRRVVLRGLSLRPEDRYPTMEALFEDLRRDPAQAWRRRATWAGAVAVSTLGVWGYTRAVAPPAVCDDDEPRLESAWGVERREQARATFEAIGRTYASDAFERVDASMTGFVQRWDAAHRDACEATWVHRAQPPEVLDRRNWCLMRTLDGAAAIGAVLADADAQVAERASATLARLEDPRSCLDADRLQHDELPPEDDATRNRVEALHAELATITALELVGRYSVAMTQAERVLAEAEALDHPPILAQAHLALAKLHVGSADASRAKHELLLGLAEAERAALDPLKFDLLNFLTHVEGSLLHRREEAQSWADLAEAALDRVGLADARRRATLAERRSELAYESSDARRALTLLRDAIALREQDNPHHPDLAGSYHNLGVVLAELGDDAGALAQYERALEVARLHYGAEHPGIGLILEAQAGSYVQLGAFERSADAYGRAHLVYVSALGERHPLALTVHRRLAFVRFKLGEFDAAMRELELGRADGTDPQGTDGEDYTRGWIHLALGDFEAALGDFQTSHAAALREHDPTSAITTPSLDGIGEALVALGRPREAIVQYEHAIALTRMSAESSYPLGYHWLGLGLAQLAAGDPESAAESLQRALDMLEPRTRDATVLGRARAALAQALWDAPGQRTQARVLADEARGELGRWNARARRDLAPTFAWLDAHR